MKTFTVNIYTPEKFFGTFEAVSLTCPGLDGEICIMRDHMPMLLAIKEGKIKLRTENETRFILTDNGTVTVANNTVNIFTDICGREEDGAEDIAECIAKHHTHDRESIRIHKHHEIHLARIVSGRK